MGYHPKISWFSLVVVPGILAIHFLPAHPDRFRDQAYWIFMAMWLTWVFLMANQLKSKVIIPILFWLGYSAVGVFGVKFSPYGKLANWFDGPASISLLWVTLSVTLLSIQVSRGILFEVFKIAALINSVFLVLQVPGILDNPAEDAALVAMVSPLILFSNTPGKDFKTSIPGILFKALVIGGIIASKSATGIFALVTVLLSHSILTKRTRIALVVIPVIGLGIALQKWDLIASNGRTFIWDMTWNWFKENGNAVKGMGLGTFEVLGPGIQRDHGMTQGFFVFMHNEWFQTLFELGAIGITLAVVLYFWVLIKKEDTQLRVCWLTLGLVAMTQSPLRIPIMGLWSVLLALEMIQGDDVDGP